jgi:hypothetical protein
MIQKQAGTPLPPSLFNEIVERKRKQPNKDNTGQQASIFICPLCDRVWYTEVDSTKHKKVLVYPPDFPTYQQERECEVRGIKECVDED